MLPAAMTTMTMGELPGLSLHHTTTAKIKTFDDNLEENMTWLKEVLEDAKREFGSEEMSSFPKTPAMKRRRQRVNRRVSTLHNDDTGNQPPMKKKRSSRASRKSMVAPVRRSARASARRTVSTQNGRARSRTPKKVQLTKDNVEPMQELSSSSCPADTRGAVEKVLTMHEPKPSADSGVVTTAEVPMDTEDGTKEAALPHNAECLQPEADRQPCQKTNKRNTTSKGKGGSKKLRLNGGQGIATVSDSTASDESEIDPPPADSEPDSVQQDTADSSSGSSKKDAEQVKSETDSISETKTSAAGRPKRKNAASRYKDHVKRLINHHEHLIADQANTSEDEFQSPVSKTVTKKPVGKATKGARAKKNQEGMVHDDTSEYEFQSPIIKTGTKKPVGKPTKGTRGKKNQEWVVPDEVGQSTPEKQEVIVEEKAEKQEVIVEEKADDVAKTDDVHTENTKERATEEDTVPTETCGPTVTSKLVSSSEEQVLIPETVKTDDAIPTNACLAVENPGVVIKAEEGDKSDVMSKSETETPIDEDSLNEQSIAEDSLEQHSIADDSLNKNETPETPEQQPQVNMTDDSLDLPNLTLDSLDHNASHNSSNQSTSWACVTRQSLRKNLRHSTRRSSVAVSFSKKRSSVYQHRTSIRKSVRLSTRNPLGTRAAVRRITMDKAQETVGEEEQAAVMEELLPEEAAVEPPKETQSTPPMSASIQPIVINQETQRVTRAASRIAEKQELPTNECKELSGTPESPSSNASHETRSSSDDDDIVYKTPSPKCPPNKVVRPRGTFLSSGKKESKYLNNLHGMMSSFIKRNTPQKQTATERQQEIKKTILNKQKRDEEIRRKLEADKQKQRELQKRKREERIKKVTEARERRAALQEQKRQEMEQKQQEMNRMTSKQKEEKKQEEILRKQMLMKKKAEADERRKQEEQARQMKILEQEEEQKRHLEMILRKREFEEQERQRRIDEARRLQEQRRVEMERQRQEELQKRREMELAKEREQQLLKEEREREKRLEMEFKREMERRAREEAIEKERRIEAERIARERERQQDQKHLADMLQKERERCELEKQQREKAEHDRLKASILKHNTSACANTSACLNTTATKETSPDCYDITPKRVPVPSTTENYVIDDIESGDSTDEEDAPRKKIPSWAQGAALKAALIKQFYHPPPHLDVLFGPITNPDLSVIFAKKKARFMKRTSSAVWDSPMLKV